MPVGAGSAWRVRIPSGSGPSPRSSQTSVHDLGRTDGTRATVSAIRNEGTAAMTAELSFRRLMASTSGPGRIAEVSFEVGSAYSCRSG
jgi:hypothetical protein